MLSLHCGAGLFSLSHYIQVFVGLSLSTHAPRACSLVHRIFHHLSKETESPLCLSFPRLCRKLTVLTGADAFPTRRRRGRKILFFSLCDLCASQPDIAFRTARWLGWGLGVKAMLPSLLGDAEPWEPPHRPAALPMVSAPAKGSPDRRNHRHLFNICLKSYSLGNRELMCLFYW